MKKLFFWYGVYCFCVVTSNLLDPDYVEQHGKYLRRLRKSWEKTLKWSIEED